MKKYFLCMVALLSLAIVACESDDTAPAPTVRPTFDLIDAQPDVTSAVVAANIESKGEVPISEVGFSYQEAGGEYVDVVCTNFKDGLARQTLTGLKPDTEYRWYCCRLGRREVQCVAVENVQDPQGGGGASGSDAPVRQAFGFRGAGYERIARVRLSIHR